MASLLCWVTLTCATANLANSTVNDLFNALTGWVVASVQWLLNAVADVLNATSDPGTIVNAANAEFDTLLRLSPALVLLGVLVTTVQCLRHADQAALWRLYVGVTPACVAGLVLARPLALTTLQIIDSFCATAATNSATHISDLATTLTTMPATPSFGLYLLSCLLIVAGVFLWIELLFRSVALTLLLVLVPIVVPLTTFPALRRIGWRLAETFLVLAGSKLVVVITLAVGLDEVTTPTATTVLAGVVTLLVACATPFLVLRLVPMMEASAVHAFDGLRQRAVRAAMGAPSSPVGLAVSAIAPREPLEEPPIVGEDLGLPTWMGDGDLPLPPMEGERPSAPVGRPQVRTGRVAYLRDKFGPVIGWHWDD